MSVSIVIPNWNGAEKLRKNLPKVLEVEGVMEIIVSDDASSDSSIEVIKNEFPKVKLLIREKNGGFSKNVNWAVKQARGDFIFLVNSDAVPEKNSLKSVLKLFKDQKVFSVSCNTGGSFSWAQFKDGFFWHYQSKEKAEKVHETLWASGGSGIFRKDIWEKLGGFDEIYSPFYEEDLDLGYRAIKRGYINLWDPDSKVEHYREVGVIAKNFSSEKINSVAQRNQLLFIWKNMTDEGLLGAHISALIKKLLTNPKYWLVFVPALLKLGEILKKREIEKIEAKLTDQEILNKFSYN